MPENQEQRNRDKQDLRSPGHSGQNVGDIEAGKQRTGGTEETQVRRHTGKAKSKRAGPKDTRK